MNYGKKGVRAKQRALNAKGGKWGRKLALSLVKLTLAAIIGSGVCGAAACFGFYRGILSSTPTVPLSDVAPVGEATIVYDREGNEIDQYVSVNSNRIPINDMDLIPKNLGNAFVAIEDERFYQHNGVDLQRLLSVSVKLVMTLGREKQGASTITQQLLKNTIFTTWTEEDNNFIKMLKRKFQEQYLALEISKFFSREEILLRYMNVINLGQNTLGVEAASQRYFGKSCSDLTLSECAVIASITQNPSGYNPIRHPELNVRRRQDCLDKMLELGFITEAEYAEALADTDAVYERILQHDANYRTNTNTTAGSYFSDAVYEQVRKDLINIAGYSESMAETLLTSGGLRIESTMDPTIQAIMDEEFANPDHYPSSVQWFLSYALTIFDTEGQPHHFSKENMRTWFQKNHNKKFNLIFNSEDEAEEAIVTYRTAMLAELGVADDEDNYLESISMTRQPQAAMVIEDQRTGYVVAMVGGRGVKEGRRTLNRATDSMRSPGSLFKVLATFAPALDSASQTLATVYNDAPFNYNGGTPVNNWYKTGYEGISSIRDAIRRSKNIVAVKTLTVITPQLGYDYLLRFGFTTLTDGVQIGNQIYSDVQQPMALGGLTYGVKPFEVNAAYATIANLGTYVEPKLYSRVTNSEGDVILDNTDPVTRRVIKETTAYLLTDAMVDVVTTGTGTAARFDQNMAIAGKTGTTSDSWDVWFAGFTPYYTCTAWAGYDNNLNMEENNGNNVARSLWRAVMGRVHENLPDERFRTPQGIVRVQVCSLSGKLPIEGVCDAHVKTELFAEGTIPADTCDIHYLGAVCRYDDLPASPGCPFPAEGIATLPLIEDAALIPGSTMFIDNPDGTVTPVIPLTAPPHCMHDETFYANPDYEAVINAQQWELTLRELNAAAGGAAGTE